MNTDANTASLWMMMKTVQKALFLLLVIGLPVGAIAQTTQPVHAWKTGSYGVKSSHLAMPLTEEEFYTDRYTAEAWFEDGTRAYVSVLVSNLGPGTGQMTLKSRWTDKNGKSQRFEKKLKQGDYKVKSSPFSLEAAGHKLSGSPRKFSVKAKGSGYSYSLTFKSGLAPWRPGKGRTTFGVDEAGYMDTTLVQPKAEVSGTATIGGSTTSVKGYGYVIHTHGNMPPYNMFKRFFNVRSLDGDTVVYLKQFKTPKQYGGKKVGYLYIARGGKKVLSATWFKLKVGKVQTDTKHSNRYKIPFEITATAKKKNTEVTVKVLASAITRRKDALKSRGMLEAALIRQFAQPVKYTLDATVEVSIREGDAEPVVTTTKATYELDHLNK